MIKRNTWIVLAIFVLVLGFALYYQSVPKKATATPAPTSSMRGLFTNLDEKSIATLRIEDRTGKATALGRDSAGLWVITEPKGGPTDVTQAETAVSQLLALQSISSLDPTSDLGIFGLSKPTYTVTITMNNGTKNVLIIGDVTPVQTGYYVRLNQNPPDIVNKDSIDAMLGMLSHPPFVSTPTPAAGATLRPQGSGTLEAGTPAATSPASQPVSGTPTPAASATLPVQESATPTP